MQLLIARVVRGGQLLLLRIGENTFTPVQPGDRLSPLSHQRRRTHIIKTSVLQALLVGTPVLIVHFAGRLG